MSDLEGMAPTPKRCTLARERALKVPLHSRLFPTFRGIEFPVHNICSGDSRSKL